MNKSGSFEETLNTVRALSEHRLKRIPVKPRRSCRAEQRPLPRFRSDAPVNIALAVSRGWCSAPVAMRPTTDEDYSRMSRARD